MKHLLIILSFLLLSSPLFGQSKKQTVLYQYKTYSGFIWKSIGNKKVQPKYEGEITNGKPNGQGTQTWSNGDKYVGEWKDGETKRSWYCHFTRWELCQGIKGE